jgi:hypothetical protein
MEPRTGVEPVVGRPTMAVLYQTRIIGMFERPELDSNQGPSPPRGDVLPLNYQDRVGAGARIRTRNDGFEGRSDHPFHHTCRALHVGTDPTAFRPTGGRSSIELMQHGTSSGPRTQSRPD